MTVELGRLGFDGGAHVILKLALAELAAGEEIGVLGTHPDLLGQLATWCRQQGHAWRVAEGEDAVAFIARGASAGASWVGAEPAGDRDAPVQRPSAAWGLAARGAMVEAGGPAPQFALDDGDVVWTERAGAIYAQAAAGQWDPRTAIDWDAPTELAPHVEAAVIQVMTFLIENEEAALVVPARFLGQVHPHFREIQQVLAVTLADEARHIEVFTRRAGLSDRPLALSSVGGRASLQTLLAEPDFAVASFLLSVMGEGTFVSLLGFLERNAPDQLTRRIAQLTRQDEARHVAFAMGHLERHAELEPGLRSRMARAVERRHDALLTTAGLNDEVFDALVLLAAGDITPDAIARGWSAVHELQHDMNDNRRARLVRLGFAAGEADVISSLHTRNFM